jgi:hypothetical protein
MEDTIKKKAIKTILEPKLSKTHKIVKVDINKLLNGAWYGDKPSNDIITRLHDSPFENKYERAKKYIQQTKGNQIYAPYITSFTKSDSIYSLEGNHRFLVFKNYGAKEMNIGVPKNHPQVDWIVPSINECRYILNEIIVTNHFNDRVYDRMYQSSLQMEERNKVIKAANKVSYVRVGKGRIAVRIYQTDKDFKIKDYHRNTNFVGNEIWVMIEDKKATTLLVGKLNQTSNPENVKREFKVDRVYYSINQMKKKERTNKKKTITESLSKKEIEEVKLLKVVLKKMGEKMMHLASEEEYSKRGNKKKFKAYSVEISKIRKRLKELTGNEYGTLPRERKNLKPDGLDNSYDHPSEVPTDVYKYIYKHMPLLTSDATDAVRWSRIINSKDEERYDGSMTIYRAVEPQYNDSEIRAGDWVTPYKEYAEMHNNRHFNGKGEILSMDVEGEDVLVSPTGNHEEAIYAPLEYSIDIKI